MKVKELMIGDWYSWYAEGKEYFYQVDTKTFSLSEDTITNFQPVPVTEDILKIAGWKLIVHEEYGYKEWLNGRFQLIQCSDGFYACNGGIRIVNVHELQHALKLCGLTKLADNFNLQVM